MPQCPTGKKSYDSFEDAKEEERINRKWATRKHGKQPVQNPYRCKECGSVHLTKGTPRKYQERSIFLHAQLAAAVWRNETEPVKDERLSSYQTVHIYAVEGTEYKFIYNKRNKIAKIIGSKKEQVSEQYSI